MTRRRLSRAECVVCDGLKNGPLKIERLVRWAKQEHDVIDSDAREAVRRLIDDGLARITVDWKVALSGDGNEQG